MRVMEDYSYNHRNYAKTHVMFEIKGVIHDLFKLESEGVCYHNKRKIIKRYAKCIHLVTKMRRNYESCQNSDKFIYFCRQIYSFRDEIKFHCHECTISCSDPNIILDLAKDCRVRFLIRYLGKSCNFFLAKCTKP